MSTATQIVPVILAGGAGTRLWPVSRAALPKPLAQLIGDETLLQQTARRLLACAAPEHVITVGAEAHDFLVRAQLAEVAAGLGAHRLLEPCGRNTAAAIALAALYAGRRFAPDAVLWICPSDHLVSDPAAMFRAVELALPVARAGELVTFGIAPSRPETGYGYIRAGAPLAGAAAVRRVARFVEKPELAVAEALLAAGDCFWNSGMFLFRADRILAELGAHASAILQAVEGAFAGLREVPGGACEVPEGLYAAVPAQPIDKAVMERAERIVVVPCDPGWSDLGSWQAIWEQLPKDRAGNAARGDALLDRTESCLIHAEGRLVACASVRDLAVIETADAVLVSDRRDADAGKRLVALLEEAGRAEARTHAETQRPWGSCRVLQRGPAFEVREIVIAPGAGLTLQSSEHRAGHWVVVAGTATLTVHGDATTLEPSESRRVPSGAESRIENPARIPARLIQVQCAAHVGEGDIPWEDEVHTRP
ncbi:MAG TPA: mannose-1-phosphate guanylyltransferase/mannose-6-phosphate isomerase [Geminicoccaceae bacterium]